MVHPHLSSSLPTLPIQIVEIDYSPILWREKSLKLSKSAITTSVKTLKYVEYEKYLDGYSTIHINGY